MNPKKSSRVRANADARNQGPMSPVLKWGVIAVLVFCCAGLAWHFRRTPANPPAQTGVEELGSITAVSKPKIGPPASRQAAAASTIPASTPLSVTTTAAPPVPVAGGPIDPTLAALVGGLRQLSGTNVELSAEAVGAWKTNFLQLVQNGPSAVPALRGFLDQKTDYPFSRDVWQATGYNSVRLAAIDALRQIGGIDAALAMEAVLGSTQSPREIAILARNLEESQPGTYRQQALAAARSQLQAAALTDSDSIDVAPLFEVMQHYGDPSVIADLEKATSSWNYYSTIALAQLADGAGIPSILRMAEGGSGSRVVALEMVAQLAPNNPSVHDFLVAQASGNTIPPNLWPYLTGPLAGDQYFPVDSAITQYPQLSSWSDLKTTHIRGGNQNLYMLPGYQSLTTEEITARTSLVDELIKVATDPAAVQALQRARGTLAQRSSRLAAQVQAGTAQGH